MNMAVGGYNTVQEWLVYEHKAKKYKPDLVTVQFTLNDLTYIYPFYIGEALLGRLKVFLGEHLNTYRFLSYMKRQRNGDVNIDQSKGRRTVRRVKQKRDTRPVHYSPVADIHGNGEVCALSVLQSA